MLLYCAFVLFFLFYFIANITIVHKDASVFCLGVVNLSGSLRIRVQWFGFFLL